LTAPGGGAPGRGGGDDDDTSFPTSAGGSRDGLDWLRAIEPSMDQTSGDGAGEIRPGVVPHVARRLTTPAARAWHRFFFIPFYLNG
jgi:hypothetical protein